MTPYEWLLIGLGAFVSVVIMALLSIVSRLEGGDHFTRIDHEEVQS